ncbi:IclR family transcriptional regulator C-terminal domain-containing protein, partial [Rhizobium ruizarguesonis]
MSAGVVSLSEMSEEKLEALFRANFPSPLTSRRVKNLASLRQELADIRRRGFSIDNGQVREGMICIGTALRDHTRCAVAGIAISL